MSKEGQPIGMKENQVRHSNNLSRLDGFYYHGNYYREGRPQLPKEQTWLIRQDMRRIGRSGK